LPGPILDDVITQVKGLDMEDVRKKVAEAEAAAADESGQPSEG